MAQPLCKQLATRRAARPRGTRLGACKATVLLVLIGVFSAAGVTSAGAFGTPLPCTSHPTSAVFSRFLDPAQYFLAENGGFELGTTRWLLTGGAVVASGNESYHVHGSTDSHGLVLPAGASAESRTACVTLGQPAIRLFVKAPAPLGAALAIHATVRNPTTGVAVETSYVVHGGVAVGKWVPTPEILIANVLGGVSPENLTLRFDTQGTSATWGVDDVYVDPFRST